VKTQPVPGTSRTLRIPLFASTLRRAMDSPSPRPVRSPPFWVKGRNIRSALPGGRPPHWSFTSIRMRSDTAYAVQSAKLVDLERRIALVRQIGHGLAQVAVVVHDLVDREPERQQFPPVLCG
jgi:hypothetical protein